MKENALVVLPDRHPSLVSLDRARVAIEEAKFLSDVKEWRDRAEALRVYSKQAKDSMDITNRCAEIKIRAERKAGEMLAEMPKRNGDPSLHDVSRLSDIGISHIESHRWQRIASVPVDVFESELKVTMDSKRELTTNAFLKLANTIKPKNGAVKVTNSQAGVFVKDLSELAGQKFGCLYVDPPWRYSNQGTRASTDNHYGTMTVDEICTLPVGDLAAERSHLHLWTTNAFLFDCQKIFSAWGFEFKSSFVWVKPQMGIGNYWRNSHEVLLLAVRGGLVGQAKNQMSWMQCKRRRHSEKPEEVRRAVEQLSPGPYLELFGRRKAKGWVVFGNEEMDTQEEMSI